MDEVLKILANNGLAIFLVIFWVFKGSKVVKKTGESFDNMNITLIQIKDYFKNFIKHENQ